MSNIHSYEFCDLPLVIHNGIEAMLTNGLAEIEYSRDGSWDIAAVCIEGRHNLTAEERAAGKSPWIYINAPAEIERLIIERLEGSEEYGKIQNAILEQLASDREDAREAQYDARRDDAMWGGVL
jgi:hypothetical protein